MLIFKTLTFFTYPTFDIICKNLTFWSIQWWNTVEKRFIKCFFFLCYKAWLGSISTGDIYHHTSNGKLHIQQSSMISCNWNYWACPFLCRQDPNTFFLWIVTFPEEFVVAVSSQSFKQIILSIWLPEHPKIATILLFLPQGIYIESCYSHLNSKNNSHENSLIEESLDRRCQG